jgi:O-antigen ligase
MVPFRQEGGGAGQASALSAARFPLGIAPSAFLLLVAAVGLVVGFNPLVGLLLALAIVFTLVVMWDLAVGLCGFLLLAYLDVVSGDSGLSLTKAAGALLIGGWVTASVGTREAKRDLLSGTPWLAVVLVGFIAWSALSAIWAASPSAALGSTLRFALNAMLFPIVYQAVRSERHLVWVLATFIVGALLSVAWGISHPAAGGASAANAAEGRLTGATSEANGLAALLMIAVVFAGALTYLFRRRMPAWSFAAAIAGTIGLVAFFATYSRGGIVAFAAALLVGLVYGGRLRPAIVGLTVAAVIVGLAIFTSSPAATQRVVSTDTSGRTDIWTVATRMVETHPIVGVGSGNFSIVSARYLLFPGTIERDDLILDTPKVAHNIYLHVLAEMGAIGIALFIGVLVLSLSAAVRAVAIFRRDDRRSLELLGRALVIAVVGNLAAEFFSSGVYSKQLWLLLALGPALLAIARQGRTERAREGPGSALRRA